MANAEQFRSMLFYVHTAQCWTFAQWRIQTECRRLFSHIRQSLWPTVGFGIEFCSVCPNSFDDWSLSIGKGVLLHLFALRDVQLSTTNWTTHSAMVIQHNPSAVFTNSWRVSKTGWTRIGQSANHFVGEHNIRHKQNLSSSLHMFPP